jgi:hypothetical protein
MNSEKASKEDGLKKVAQFKAERDAAVKKYVPPTHATTSTYLYLVYIHAGMRLICICVSTQYGPYFESYIENRI